jgi:2-phosphosulfolactate phosphatase
VCRTSTQESRLPRTFSISGYDPSTRIAQFTGAVVCIDVFRATTTAVTALALGRRCFPAVSVEDAERIRARLGDALLAGEVRGVMPESFEVQNSPTELMLRTDTERPVVLLSSSGTPLLRAVEGAAPMYVACYRNRSAVAAGVIAAGHLHVDLLGASSRGEFREEDQLCCARIAEQLMDAGFSAADDASATIVERWHGASVEDVLVSHSVEYLRRTGQGADVDFVLAHDDDVKVAFTVAAGQVVEIA